MNTNSTTSPPPDHAWVHERIAASLAAGLSREEQSLFDAHIHGCSECFDAFTEAKDADRWLLRAADSLTPSPNLEEKILTHLQEKTMKPLLFPLAKRAGLGLAAAVALAATGVFAQYILHQNLLNNPLSKQLASTNDTWLPGTPIAQASSVTFQALPLVGQHSDNIYSVYARDESDARTMRPQDREAKDDITEARPTQITDTSRRLALDIKSSRGGGGAGGFNGEVGLHDTKTAYRSQFAQLPPDAPTDARAFQYGIHNDPTKPEVTAALWADHEKLSAPGLKIQVAKTADSSYYSLGDTGRDYFSMNALTFDGNKKDLATNTEHELTGTNTYAGGTIANGGATQIIPLKSVDAVNTTPAQKELMDILIKQREGDKIYESYKKRVVSDQTRQEVQNANKVIPYNDLLLYPDNWVDLTRSRLASADAATQPSATPPSPPPDTTTQSPDIAARKIIRSGDVEFEVRSFEDAYATISSIVTEDGGYISSTSSDKIANGKVRGTIVVRVPPEKLDRFLLKLRALGDLKSQQIAASDVTKDYVDLESELRALRAMETRLIDLIKNGKGEVKDLVEAEKQLGEYRVRIEKIEGQIRYYNSQIAMATLNITAYEKDIQKPTAAFDQENVALSLETEDVEKQYLAARKILDDAKARILDSELKKADADQYAARITAEVPPDQADFVAAQLKQIGTLVSFNRDRKQTTSGGTGEPTVQIDHKPTQFSISLYNIANIAPRQTTSLTIAVTDVDAAYRKILALVRKPIPAEGNAEKLPPTGRIVTSAITGQQPEQMSADIHADIRADQTDALLDALKQTGETLANATSENPDTASSTSAKRGIQLHLVNTAAVPPRETVALREVAQNVPDTYANLTASLQALQSAGSARIISSQLIQATPQDIHASLAFEVRRDALPAVEKSFTDAGLEPIAKNTTRASDTANTLDSKVGFQITELLPADSLPPLRTTVLGIEVDNVEKAMDALRASLLADSAKEIEYTLSREPSGQIIGRLIIEAPVKNSPTLLAHIRGLGGNEKTNQVTKNTQLPETQFAKDRFELTLFTQQSIVSSDKTVGTTVRSAASTAVAALLWSLWLILTGLLFLAPFLTLGWLLQKLLRRRKPAPASA